MFTKLNKSKSLYSKKCFSRRYPRYNEIQNYLKALEVQHPSKVRVENLGCSYQGRSIYMIILQRNRHNPKQSVMIEGGIHAREWLSHTSVIYFIDYILRHPSMLYYMDFYIIPCLNPDGYEYTHKHERLWRKNMNPNGSKYKDEWGVDLNRNFSYGYGLKGSSSKCSSYMYRGTHSLSEPESKCLARAMSKYSERIKLYIAIHCYGNLILYPWGFDKRPLPDEQLLRNCAMEAQRAMKRYNSKSKFSVGNLAKKMYLSSGATSDYARGTHKIKFSYTMELHEGGRSGFNPKPNRILAVAKETSIGLKAMIKYVHRYYQRRDEQNLLNDFILTNDSCKCKHQKHKYHQYLSLLK